MSCTCRALIKNPYGDLLCLEGEDIYTWPLQAFWPCLVDVLYDYLFFYLNNNHWILLVGESVNKKILNSIIDQLHAFLNFLRILIVLLSILCLLIVHCDSVYVFRVSWLQFWTDIRVWAQFITFEYRLRIYPKWPGLRAKKGDDGRITTPPNL